MSRDRGGRGRKIPAVSGKEAGLAALLLLLVVTGGCSERGASPPDPPAPSPAASATEESREPSPGLAAEAAEPSGLAPSAVPRAAVQREAPVVEGGMETVPVAHTWAGGAAVRMTPTRDDLSYVGAGKCGICHKIQHASWKESAHASLEPPLDCEACHGPGSEYGKMKTMKDPAAARAAGLLSPTADFCTAGCHEPADFAEEMLANSHAHKEV